MNLIKSTEVKKAVYLSILCAIAYMIAYLGRNVLSAVTPQLIEANIFNTEFMGTLSSMFFITYAIGQLINGIIGEKIRSDIMIGFGLIIAGICLFIFVFLVANPLVICIVYALIGFSLSMIFAPMTKVTSENLKKEHASRCMVALELGALLGAPFAGLVAALVAWKWSFFIAAIILALMGMGILLFFYRFRKSGLIQCSLRSRNRAKGQIGVLIQNGIIRFTFVATLTGVIRTTVVFWIPTYLSQYLQFSAETAAGIFTAVTLLISLSSVLAQALYTMAGKRMNRTLLVSFGVSAVAFLGMFCIHSQWPNIICLIIAILFAQCASALIWTRYCPGLSHTGMVSTATGYLDFVSYFAAAISSVVFANAVDVIGWGNLILIWVGLMVLGVLVCVRFRKPVQA